MNQPTKQEGPQKKSKYPHQQPFNVTPRPSKKTKTQSTKKVSK